MDRPRSCRASFDGLRELGWSDNSRSKAVGAAAMSSVRAAYAAELVGLSPDVIFAYFNAQLGPALARNPQPSRSCSSARPIRLAPDMWRACRIPAATSPASRFTSRRSRASGSAFSRKSRPGLARVALSDQSGHGRSSAARSIRRRSKPPRPRSASRRSWRRCSVLSGYRNRHSVAGKAAGKRTDRGARYVQRSQWRPHRVAGGPIPRAGGLCDQPFCEAGRPDVLRPESARRGQARDNLYRSHSAGAKSPADLPVQAPVKFDLVVNLKTAKALGLTIPESFLLAPTR